MVIVHVSKQSLKEKGKEQRRKGERHTETGLNRRKEEETYGDSESQLSELKM
jgi:hypothetical protein